MQKKNQQKLNLIEMEMTKKIYSDMTSRNNSNILEIYDETKKK